MRIGLIAPPWESIPPVGYGGTEVVVDNLARALQARGHSVRLFTVATSTCPVRRDYLFAEPVDPMGTSVEEAAHVLAAYEELDDVDVIHDHTILGPLLGPLSRPAVLPVVTTHHGVFTAENRRIFAQIAEHARVVAISHSQAAVAPELPIVAVIHHGVDLERYRLGPGGGGYLINVSRMCPEKGIDSAIRVARAAGRRLIIASKMREPVEFAYFQAKVEPLLGTDIELIIEPDLETRLELWSRADALVNPISWPEPFGLVMIEALASGTPVLAMDIGAAPEIVEHGRTGFLCRDEPEMIAALDRLVTIDRASCRASAETRFSMDRMAQEYVEVYQAMDYPSVPSVVSAGNASRSPTANGMIDPGRDDGNDATLDLRRRATG
jgi:glycosyltransferase involved in cell wall biosynthesis